METELIKKLNRIRAFINVDKIIKGEKNSPADIRKYYVINDPAYRKFHSDHGFMHFRVSEKDGEKGNVYYQPDTVSKYVKSGDNVVELGPGQGANIFYLSGSRQDANWTGIDLLPPKRPKKQPNIRLIRGDYSDMRAIESESVNVVFGIETVVHSSDKDKVFKEVARILKPKGIFILYDYATQKAFSEYPKDFQTVIELISKCGACALIESDDEWEEHFSKNGFERVSKQDLGKKTLPDLHRLGLTARRVFDHDRRIKLVFGLLPKTLTNNALIAYLAEDCVKEDIFYYNEWIYRKK